MASHEELVAELPKLERLSNAARLKLAKKRRLKQLKRYQEFTRVTRQVSRSDRPSGRVNFAQNSLLQDAVSRNDTLEGKLVHGHTALTFTSNLLLPCLQLKRFLEPDRIPTTATQMV